MSVATAVDYDGLNIVVLVGEVTTPLVSRSLASGDTVSSFDVATHTEDGRLSVPISVHGESGAVLVGAQVCIVGAVRRRFFRAGGSVTSRTEVIADSVIPLRRKAQIRKALEQSVTNLLALQGA